MAHARHPFSAHRVRVDLGQILASFSDAMVVVGGWVPALLTPSADNPHVGSIDVDLALNAGMLGDGRTADLLKPLLDSRRYEQGEKDFQLVTRVDLRDGEAPDHNGPQQVAAFHASIEPAAAMHARRAFELVQSLLRTVGA